MNRKYYVLGILIFLLAAALFSIVFFFKSKQIDEEPIASKNNEEMPAHSKPSEKEQLLIKQRLEDNRERSDEDEAIDKKEKVRRNRIIGKNLSEFGPQAMDLLMEEQAPDAAWTETIMSKGAQFLGHRYPKTTLQSAECKEFVCKIVLKHESKEEAHFFDKTNGAAGGPWAIRNFLVTNMVDDYAITTMYIERNKEMPTFRKMDDVMWELIIKAGKDKDDVSMDSPTPPHRDTAVQLPENLQATE